MKDMCFYTVVSMLNLTIIVQKFLVVVGSGSGSMGELYGHVGIYIGNNQVAENIGRVNICSLDEWASKQVQICHGYKGFIGWVWLQGKSLGTGTDGSFGTAGYISFSYLHNFHKSWANTHV